MPNNIEIDFSDFNAAVKRAYEMGEVRRRDIADVFRKADRLMVTTIKSQAPKGTRDVVSKKYPSRSHKRGFLRKSIKFKVSRKYKFVYWVNPGAWYSNIVIAGHGNVPANAFVERAANQVEGAVVKDIKDGLGRLTERVWNHG